MSSKSKYSVNDGRHFENHFSDYDPNDRSYICDGKLSAVFIKKMEAQIAKLVDQLDKNIDSLDPDNLSVYTGLSGIAYFYWFMSQSCFCYYDSTKARKRADKLLEKCKGRLYGKKWTFLCGDSGPLCLMTLLHPDMSQESLAKILHFVPRIIRDAEVPDELMNGRVGLLYSLLFLSNLNVNVPSQPMIELIEAVIRSGQRNSNDLSSKRGSGEPPLMFQWHDKPYLGAAHGIVGILCVLLQAHQTRDGLVTDSQLSTLIKPTVEWMCGLQFSSGNFPSSLGSSGGDKLVHWCHGAPGWVHMFLLAHQVFKDSRYLSLAEQCGEVVWSRGLLEKGYGLCHGVAGNAYVFIALYNATKAAKHLYRAARFAERCFDYGQHGCSVPDRPFSLFEGLAGTVYFLIDLMQPDDAKFPAFCL